MALGFGDIPLEVVIRASNQLAPGLAAAGAQLKAFQREVGMSGGQLGLPGIGGAASAGGLGGMLGTLGPTLAIAGGVATIAGLGVAAKSLLETYRTEQTSLSELQQAYSSAGLSFSKSQASIDKWLDTNAGFISNLSQAREGFATLTRAGLSQTVVMQAMNEALNLAAIKHLPDLSTAVEIVSKAYQGQGRGLIDLGIHMGQFDNTTGLLTKHVLNQGQLTAELNQKLAGGVKVYDSLTIAQNQLGREWEKLAISTGPALITTLTIAVSTLQGFVQLVEMAGGAIGGLAHIIGGIRGGSGLTGGHFVGGGHGTPGTWVPDASGSTATVSRGPTPS